MEPESINQNYRLEAEILTPVHIGAGADKNWLENADYVFDQGKMYLLEHKKVMDATGPEKFAHALTSPDKAALRSILPGHVEDYASRVLDCDVATTNEIKTHTRAGMDNKPVIPGSSLKGALRSIIIHHLKPSKKIQKNHQINNKIMGSPIRGDDLGRFFKVTDASFEETKLSNTKIFSLTKKGNTIESGWKHNRIGNTTPPFKATGFNTVYEVLPPGQKGLLDLKLATLPWKNLDSRTLYLKEKNKIAGKTTDLKKRQEGLDNIASLEQLTEEKNKIVTSPLETFFQIINNITRLHLDKEIAFFEKYAQAEHTSNILAGLRELKGKIPSDNRCCILRLAAGSGFHTITGDWKLESHDIDNLTNTITTKKGRKTISRGMYKGQESAKSRKIATFDGEFMLMGFVRLRKVTEAEIIAYEEQKIQKQEEERKRLEEEAKRREKERIREQMIRERIAQANDLSAKEKFDEALEKLNEASEIKPSDGRLTEKKEAIENARKAYIERIKEEEQRIAFEEEQRRKKEALKQRQEANKAQREKENQKILEQGLAKLTEINDFDEGRKVVENYFELNQEQIPESEKTHLMNFAQRMKQQKPKHWKKATKGNWKLIAKWIGKTEAKQWFEQMNQ